MATLPIKIYDDRKPFWIHIAATHGRRKLHYMHNIHQQGQQRLYANYYQKHVLHTSSERKENKI